MVQRLTVEFEIETDDIDIDNKDHASTQIKDVMIREIQIGDFNWEIERLIDDLTEE